MASMSSTHCRLDLSSCEKRRKFSSESAAWLASARSSRFSSVPRVLLLRSKQSVPSFSLSLDAMRMKIAATGWFRRDRFAAISLGSARVSISFCISRAFARRSEEHTSELQSHSDLVCRLLLEKKKKKLKLK